MMIPLPILFFSKFHLIGCVFHFLGGQQKMDYTTLISRDTSLYLPELEAAMKDLGNDRGGLYKVPKKEERRK